MKHNLSDNIILNKNDDIDNKDDKENDDKEYIDLSKLYKDRNYQIQIENDKLKIVNIGNFSDSSDIIIKKDFGENNNMTIYSCIYNEDELKHIINDNKITLLTKLVIKDNLTRITGIGIRIFEIDEKDINKIDTACIKEWKLYYIDYIENSSSYSYIELDKIINKQNIIEKMIENTISN